MPDTVETTNWGYRYTLDKGDVVEVGDATLPDFKAHVKTIRGSAWFSIALPGGSFVPSLNGTRVTFPFNASINVSVYPVAPCERLPDGGIEYDLNLLSRPAQTTITMNIDWQGITWKKLLALNIEYNQAKCEEQFGLDGAPYVLTATSITDNVGQVVKSRPEYEVNSYQGIAVSNRHAKEQIGVNKNNGEPIFYSKVSRSTLHIHRGLMTDNVGNQAWVDDINIDETKKQITFTLPRDWLRTTAVYPVNQVCGVDPAYTQDMDSWQSNGYGGSDGTWGNYDIYTNKGVPKGAVAEIILSNATVGTENTIGIRTDGSALNRFVVLHEAEGGGQTHARMFVLVDATTGLVEPYHSDVSDADYFYLVGYWENVTFTEEWLAKRPLSAGTWYTYNLAGYAGLVMHWSLVNNETDLANTMGIRAVGSSLERKLLVHEPESGGSNVLDMFVKANAISSDVQLYTSDDSIYTDFYIAGVFGSELDFVETWQSTLGYAGTPAWAQWDISAYLDQDGRMADFLMVNVTEDYEATLGVRDGDDSTTVRSLLEHEAESAGAGGEYTGFSMSAQSNSSGVVNIYLNDVTLSWPLYYLTGYFKPVSAGTNYPITCTANLSASPVMAYLAAWDRTVNSGIDAQASIGRTFDSTRATTSNLSLLASVAKGFGRSIASTCNLALTTTVARTLAFTRPTSSSLSLAVSTVRTFPRSISATCNIALSSAVGKTVGFARASNSGLSVLANIAKVYGRTIVSISVLSLLSTVSRVVNYTRATSSGLTLLASVIASTLKNYLVTITTNLSTAVSVARSMSYVRASSGALSLAVSVSKSFGKTIASTSSLVLSTTMTRSTTYTRAAASNLVLAVSVVRSFGRTIVTSAGLTASATVNRTASFIRSTTSSLNALTSLIATLGGGAVNYAITIITNLSLSTSINRSLSVIRTSTSNLNLTTSIIRTFPRTIITSCNLALTATVSRAIVYTRVTVSNLSLLISMAISYFSAFVSRRFHIPPATTYGSDVSETGRYGDSPTTTLGDEISKSGRYGSPE